MWYAPHAFVSYSVLSKLKHSLESTLCRPSLVFPGRFTSLGVRGVPEREALPSPVHLLEEEPQEEDYGEEDLKIINQ